LDPARQVSRARVPDVIRGDDRRDADGIEAAEKLSSFLDAVSLGSNALDVVRDYVRETSPGTAAKESIDDPTLERHERMAVVDHHADPTPGPGDTNYLDGCGFNIWSVVDHSPRVDKVEAAIWKWEMLGVRTPQLRPKSFSRKSELDKSQALRGEVHSGSLGAASYELDEIRPGTNSHL
jgi:hypothetical protein